MASCSNVNPVLCTGCSNTLISFITKTENADQLREFLYGHGVLPSSNKCPNCVSEMTLNEENQLFQCWNRIETVDKHKKKLKVQCKMYVSQYSNTWFENHNLSKQVICRFVAFWALTRPPRHDLLLQELDLSPHSVVDWSNYLREVCVTVLSEKSQIIGGPGKIVEIDEAKIGNRKYNRGRNIVGNWVFGGIERDSHNCFLLPVATRGQTELLPIIKQYILPGTTIVSDCWKTYNCLESEGYSHLTVNHSYNFVDPDTGAHTQHIERLWREVRGNVPRYGNTKQHFIGHLAEFQFKRKYSDYKERLHYIFRAIGEVYDGKTQEKLDIPNI